MNAMSKLILFKSKKKIIKQTTRITNPIYQTNYINIITSFKNN